MKRGEEKEVCDLVARVFSQFVAPLYSPQGVKVFLSYVDPNLLINRIKSNHFVLVAEQNVRIIGAIEVRNNNHISNFFIEGEYQNKGIGKQLWKNALTICLTNKPELAKVTVHAAPNSVRAYKSLGFYTEGPEQTEYGIRYVPMALDIKKDDEESN